MTLTDQQVAVFREQFPSTVENEAMSKHTSFRIGGSARLYLVAPTSEEIVRAVSVAAGLGIPWYVYGGGSNLLVADAGFPGLVIQAANRGLTINDERSTIHAEAGAITALAARQSVDAGLTGFEWAIGVPGTIGGALYGNAGCYGGEMKDVVESVSAYRIRDRARVTFSNADCRFAYRESMFKSEPHVILACTLALRKAEDATGKRRMEDIMRERKEHQPLEQSSCGCAFKNFDFHDGKELEILKRRIDEIPGSMLAAKRLSAGWLIDQVGMKGKRIGGVEVSSKHGNFFVVTGAARAEDVVALISLVKMKVRDELGIELQEEVQYLGF